LDFPRYHRQTHLNAANGHYVTEQVGSLRPEELLKLSAKSNQWDAPTDFFSALRKLPPTFPPESTPAYSNIAYQILGYALERIKGKSWYDLLNDKVLLPLKLQHTYYTFPNESSAVGIIPGTFTETGWANQLGEEGP
jgi:CubicO group peptidase (beta-lactamase class C family)